MEMNKKTHRSLQWHNWSFVLLFLAVVGLLAYLSTRYNYEADWTMSGRHTLSQATTTMLDTLEGPVTITAFARDSELVPLRKRISQLIDRYQQHKSDITLTFIDPDQEPTRVREAGVSVDGEMVVSYAGRSENLRKLGEEALTNTLQRLARGGDSVITFIEGHGERNPEGQANHDVSEWANSLKQKGFRFERVNLAVNPVIPANTSMLVLADARTELLKGEQALILDYVNNGGNLLWLVEPDTKETFPALAETLGVTLQDGTVVDPTGRMLGIDHPALVLVAQYPRHAITGELTSVTLFPVARPLDIDNDSDWTTTPILTTLERSWAESGPLQGTIRHDAERELAGPLMLGIALEREVTRDNDENSKQQRVVVIGDADFISNAYLGNGANLDLGSRMANWLSHDDQLITIPPRTAPDTSLNLSPMTSSMIGLVFLLLLPAGLLATGLTIWFRRRKA